MRNAGHVTGSNPSDDDARDVLEGTSDNPTYMELVDAIDPLSDLQKRRNST
jgi:hypothetical protein